jgi:hypothetical protein
MSKIMAIFRILCVLLSVKLEYSYELLQYNKRLLIQSNCGGGHMD